MTIELAVIGLKVINTHQAWKETVLETIEYSYDSLFSQMASSPKQFNQPVVVIDKSFMK